MKLTLAGAAFVWTALLCACAPPNDPKGPVSVVEKLYGPYLKGGAVSDTLDQPVFTAPLAALIRKAGVYGELLDEPVLDYDPIADAQDFKLSHLHVSREGTANDNAAVVRAHFDNFDKPVDVFFDMRRETGAWKIDNVRAHDGDLRGIIADALKPAGDPASMETPVKAVYAAYGEKNDRANPVAPLHRWADLSAGLKPIMEMEAAQAKRADHDPLGFDPVVDGAAWNISDLKLEAASSAVIARFKNGGAQKVLVFDVIQEGGAWKIDNIRSPGQWDVRMKLSDLGIK